MKTKTLLAWIGIFLVSFVPVLLLFLFGPKNYSSITHTLGQIAGLVGMTLFSITFLLSTRSNWVENLFDGLDKVYLVHAVVGATGMIALLFHPLLLVMKFLPDNFKLAARYITPGGLMSVDYGIYALAGLIILIAVTLYSKLRYENWKVSHEFLGIFFMFAVLHIFLVRSTVARDYIFSGYYVYAGFVSFIGLGAFAYSLFLRKVLKTKSYKVEKITRLSFCTELLLAPKDAKRALSCKAGQFIFVRFPNKRTGAESHPFSIALISASGRLTIIAKELGDFTKKLSMLKEGDAVIVEGPYGRFHHQLGFKDEIWVAGGIGITPFIGLAEEFSRSRTGNVELFYTVKSPDEFVHLEELENISRSQKRFKLHPWIKNEKGFLTLEEIEKKTPVKGKTFYLCGPSSLKESMKAALAAKGIHDVHDERFNFK